MPIDTYMVLLFHFAIISTAGEMVALSVGDAHAWCRGVMFTLVPAVVQKFLFLRKYKSFLPDYYGTVKAKCFQNGKKTCSKVGHSCLRKVVLFAAWPFRKRWRVIHRGLETVLRPTGIGDEVWSLKEACPILEHRMRFADVAHGDPYCCRCGCPKSNTVAVTADAGQFFEAVQARQAIAAARRVLRKCAAMTNKTCVTALRGPKRTAFIGGCNRAAYKRGFVFTFMELFLSFAACMFMCYVTLGDICFGWKACRLAVSFPKLLLRLFLLVRSMTGPVTCLGVVGTATVLCVLPGTMKWRVPGTSMMCCGSVGCTVMIAWLRLSMFVTVSPLKLNRLLGVWVGSILSLMRLISGGPWKLAIGGSLLRGGYPGLLVWFPVGSLE